MLIVLPQTQEPTREISLTMRWKPFRAIDKLPAVTGFV